MPREFKYFTRAEFRCPCGCGLSAIDERLVEDLDFIRGACGFPLAVNSGCRCQPHNAEVGGKQNSAHTPQADGKCHGADIRVVGSRRRYLFLKHAVGRFNRVGIGKDFIHVDNDESKPPEVAWLY